MESRNVRAAEESLYCRATLRRHVDPVLPSSATVLNYSVFTTFVDLPYFSHNCVKRLVYRTQG